MSENSMSWVDKREEKIKEERSQGYFDIVEGKQQFVLLTHMAPLAQVFDPATKKYRPAEEGDSNVSIKGVCWILHDGKLKQAKLPYTIVKAVREIQLDPEWDFKFPFPHPLTLSAKNAGTKEVEYGLTPSPKKVEIPAEILRELRTKPFPEDIVEKIRGKSKDQESEKPSEYPKDDMDPEEVPF